MDPARAFSVVFDRDVRLDVPAVAREFAAATGRNLFDARVLARKARGIVAEDLPEETARRLEAALHRLGVGARVLASDAVPRFPKPLRAVSAVLDAGGAEFSTGHRGGNALRVSWAEVRCIACAVVARPSFRDFFETSTFACLPALHRLGDEEARGQIKQRLASRALRREAAREIDLGPAARVGVEELDALARDRTDGYLDLFVGETLRLRVARHDFRFDALAPEPGSTSAHNFRRLLSEFVARCPGAAVPPVTRGFLDGVELLRIVFDCLDEFERYLRWWFLLHAPAAAGGETGAAGSERPPA
jgi:hypothetical protein